MWLKGLYGPISGPFGPKSSPPKVSVLLLALESGERGLPDALPACLTPEREPEQGGGEDDERDAPGDVEEGVHGCALRVV